MITGDLTWMLFDVVRHERGLDTLLRIGGPQAAAPITAMNDIAPDLVRFAIDFAYGEVLSRPGLDLKMRQLCTVAALRLRPTAADPVLTALSNMASRRSDGSHPTFNAPSMCHFNCGVAVPIALSAAPCTTGAF